MRLCGIILLLLLLVGCQTDSVRIDKEQPPLESSALEEQLLWPEPSDADVERLYSAKDSETQKWGFVDQHGTWIIEPKYDRTDGIGGEFQAFPYLLVKEEGKWGYMNLDEEWVIPPIHASSPSFYNGYLWIAEEGEVAQPFDQTGKSVNRIFAQSYAEEVGLQFKSSSETNPAVGYAKKMANGPFPPILYP